MPRLAELLGGGQVKEKISFDKSLRGLVVEDEFSIRVAVYVFIFKVGVEVWVHFDGFFVFGREDDAERDLFVFLFCALFGKAFGADDFGVWVLLVPGADVDVMLCASCE